MLNYIIIVVNVVLVIHIIIRSAVQSSTKPTEPTTVIRFPASALQLGVQTTTTVDVERCIK